MTKKREQKIADTASSLAGAILYGVFMSDNKKAQIIVVVIFIASPFLFLGVSAYVFMNDDQLAIAVLWLQVVIFLAVLYALVLKIKKLPNDSDNPWR
jgi:hypothetical protein